MATKTYTASLAYWGNQYGQFTGSACQGNATTWGGDGARNGVMYFNGLASLKGSTINSVKLSATIAGGNSGNKNLKFYKSTKSGVNDPVCDYRGTKIGELTVSNGTILSKDVTDLFGSVIESNSINDTFIIYSTAESDYMKLTDVSLIVDYTIATNCTAPASFVVNPNPFATTLTLSWSGAKSGTNNSIVSFFIQYALSSDNATWGDWITLKTISSSATSGVYSYTPTLSNGDYIKFRIRTQGDAGSSYYSDYKNSSSVRKYITNCTAPTNATFELKIYEIGTVLSWSGAKSGTNNSITGYEIQIAVSVDNTNWSEFKALKTISNTETSGQLTVSYTVNRGEYIRCRIRTLGSSGSSYYSPWKNSDSARKNSVPGIPQNLSVSDLSPSLNDTITISWGAATDVDNNLAGYNIYANNKKCASTATTQIVYTINDDVKNIVFAVRAYDYFNIEGNYASITINRLDKELNYMLNNLIKRLSCYTDVNGSRKKISLFRDIAENRQRIIAPKMNLKTENTISSYGAAISMQTPISGVVIAGTVYATTDVACKLTITCGNQNVVVGKMMEGIHVTNGENYTDPDGQQWLCDSYDIKTCILTKRVENGVPIAETVYQTADIDYPSPIYTSAGTTEISINSGIMEVNIKICV